MPHPKHVPHIANAVLLLALGACVALLLGAPLEKVLVLRENPLSRVVVVTFGMSLVGLLSLSFALHLLLHRHRAMEKELDAMRRLVGSAVAGTEGLAASIDALETRVESSVHRMQTDMATERERMRAQVRAYTQTPEVRR